MQALNLMDKVLIEPGGLIAAQSPTDEGALDSWQMRNLRSRPLHLDAPDFDAQAGLAGAQFA